MDMCFLHVQMPRLTKEEELAGLPHSQLWLLATEKITTRFLSCQIHWKKMLLYGWRSLWWENVTSWGKLPSELKESRFCEISFLYHYTLNLKWQSMGGSRPAYKRDIESPLATTSHICRVNYGGCLILHCLLLLKYILSYRLHDVKKKTHVSRPLTARPQPTYPSGTAYVH